MDWHWIAGCALAYLIGSFSTSVWLGRWFFGVDVRTQGSGNAGATNTFRVLGVWPGIVVMVIDVLKAYLPVVFIPQLFAPALQGNALINFRIALSAAVVLGHVFPLYTSFRGGKGVATLVGVILALYNPWIIVLLLLWFVAIFVFTRFVSLGSITAALWFPVLVWFMDVHHPALLILSVAVGVFVPLTHHKNIVRLLHGTENKLSFRKKVSSAESESTET